MLHCFKHLSLFLFKGGITQVREQIVWTLFKIITDTNLELTTTDLLRGFHINWDHLSEHMSSTLVSLLKEHKDVTVVKDYMKMVTLMQTGKFGLSRMVCFDKLCIHVMHTSTMTNIIN
ncbi:hypothetical protein P879_10761 [Paragonimus westermani]|uniref:Uncharacterized protein n=1 Tax=Paragonimus westermani TaxID=34504 RepID=A0A8T0D5H3_9TREM|nr:hypothetical protein P879_10761 [Paragonimus westermani]